MAPTPSNDRDAASGPAVVLCDCVMATPAQGALIAEADERIRVLGLRALRVRDLCGVVARRERRFFSFIGSHPLLVLACRPRAVRLLLHAAGIDGSATRVQTVDLRQAPDIARAEVAAGLHGVEAGAVERLEPSDAWVPWFPIVDYGRCQRCGQCASFCVFGVYSSQPGGGVEVTRPEGCKTNCPACARLCPSAAIVFPKHNEPPFDGSEVSDEDTVRARARQARLELLGDDPYAALQARRRKVELLRRTPPTGVRP